MGFGAAVTAGREGVAGVANGHAPRKNGGQQGGSSLVSTGRARNAAGGALGHKRPRTGGGDGQRDHHHHHQQKQRPLAAVGVRQRDAAVVRIKAAGSSSSSSSSTFFPMVSPPELMPRRGASGSLVRQIAGGAGGAGGAASGDGAFRPVSRLRQAAQPGGERNVDDSGAGGTAGLALGLGLELGVLERRAGGGGGPSLSAGVGRAGTGGWAAERGEGGITVIECSALDQEFRGLPARRYTLVTVTRGGMEVWRDYVAGVASACCGNDRVAAVGAEDGSVYVYNRRVVYIVCYLVFVCVCVIAAAASL